jgi:hypothetical protein
MAALHVSPLEKKPAEQKGKLVFEDEASFRQDSTLYRTWSRVGVQPLVPVVGGGEDRMQSGRLTMDRSFKCWRRFKNAD